jgi:type VI secretion system protein ImpG
VTSVGSFLAEPVRYEPFYALRHGLGSGSQAHWFSSRRPSPRKDDHGDRGLPVVRGPELQPAAAGHRDDHRPRDLHQPRLAGPVAVRRRPGGFRAGGAGARRRVRCLRKPTRSLRPPLGRDGQWRLISHLALNHLSLADNEEGLEALREALTIYDFADTAVTRQQIAGITRVSSRRVPGRLGRGLGSAIGLGLEVTLEFDEAEYVGSGVYLLASVLERFLGLYASINSFCQLVARTKQREGIVKRWPPRAGERTLL